ncbi:4-amino-4-deoxy-L-arabinose transferase [Verrucomicrobium sp. GAS474]|uniref:ArnT family glycosyltransferase n=1 Tax=Verrucomicrobium sp. GAS474 TaxID=1882831 RepID=UPI00087DF26C|nr:glycosyltransferase family 39 protein [Verrucomicrobium sp. GAS474]SDU23881.1 4-amino-4-deoxy-L-arabinose transferase [Verrucomicrobium sp. GAS474]
MPLFRSPRLPEFSTRAQIALLLGVAVLLFCGSFGLPLIDRDEPRFAQATREMMERHDWIVPTFNGEYRFDKPPLTYWTMAVFYALGGINELTARLHSIVSTVALGFVVWGMGRKWFSAGAGFAAAFSLLTSLQILLHGRLSVADMPMVLAVTVAQWALFDLLTDDSAEGDKKRRGRLLTLYFALAAGFLAKGPITLAVPVVTMLLFRFVFWRRQEAWGRLKIGQGLLLVLLVIGLWGIPGLIKTHGLWWSVGMEKHVVERGLEPLNSRAYFAPYYLCTAFLSFFPWAALFGYVIVLLQRNWNRQNAFLFSWLVAPYLIFAGYATQLPHYILPAMPAFFLLLGQAPGLAAPLPRWPRIVAWTVCGLYAALFLFLHFVVLAAPWVQPYLPLREALIGLSIVLAGGITLIYVYETDRLRHAVWAVILIGLGFFLIGVGFRPLLPALRIAQIEADFAARTGKHPRLVAQGFAEGSLVFYTGRHWDFVPTPDDVNKIVAAADAEHPILAVTLENEIHIDTALKHFFQGLGHGTKPSSEAQDLKKKIEEQALYVEGVHPGIVFTGTAPTGPNGEVYTYKFNEYETVSGINFARASWVKLRVIVRP